MPKNASTVLYLQCRVAIGEDGQCWTVVKKKYCKIWSHAKSCDGTWRHNKFYTGLARVRVIFLRTCNDVAGQNLRVSLSIIRNGKIVCWNACSDSINQTQNIKFSSSLIIISFVFVPARNLLCTFQGRSNRVDRKFIPQNEFRSST